MGVAVRKLEDALATAAWRRGEAWNRTVHSALLVVQRVLRETRQEANREGSLLSQVASEAPRLEQRARHLRREYAELERVVESLCVQIEVQMEPEADAEEVRQRLRWMISELRRIEATETELLYEAFWDELGNED